MTYSAELAELAKALAAAQGEFGAIPLDSSNPFFNSRYASLASVIETAQPILVKHGLSVSQHLGHDDGGDTLTTYLLHSSGQWIADSMRLRPVKNDPQSQGSATTYARRYSYQAVLGLVADDDDGAAGSKTVQQAPRQQAKKSTRQSRSEAPAVDADPETGEKLHNLTPLMLSEIHGAERPKFIQALETKHHCQIAKVPESLVAEVEAMIGAWVGQS